MLTCKEVCHLVSQSLDKELPLRTRVGMRIHLLLCGMCATYKKQTIQLRTVICKHLEKENEELSQSGPSLSEEAKAAMKEALNKEF